MGLRERPSIAILAFKETAFVSAHEGNWGSAKARQGPAEMEDCGRKHKTSYKHPQREDHKKEERKEVGS